MPQEDVVRIIDRVFNPNPRKKATAMESLLKDFPWLWALRNTWSGFNHRDVKISQEMADLKMVLSLQSKETPFSLWSFREFGGDNLLSGGVITNVTPRETNRWAEAVIRDTGAGEKVTYITISDPIYGKCHQHRQITIFRHPEKLDLNGIVDDVARLHGSSARWRPVPGLFC
jgi:hypothetical protein